MRARGGVVGLSLVSGPDAVTVVDNVLHFCRREGLLLLQPKDLDLVVFVLENLEFLLIIQ